MSHFKVEQLYIKWNEKFTITAKNIEITTTPKKKQEKSNKRQLKEFFDVLRNVREFSDLVKEVDIQRIAINNYQLSYKFKEGTKSYLTLQSDKLKLDANLREENNRFIVDINRFHIIEQDTTIHGTVVFDNKHELITSKLDWNIRNDANLTSYIYMNTHRMFYSVESHNIIKNLPVIIQSLKLPNYIHKWVYDAVKLNDANIYKFYGYVNINQPDNLIKTIHADAELSNVAYTFDTRLAPVSASNVYLKFERGILDIHLKNGLFHKQELQNSFLDIDLNPEKYILHLYLHDKLSLDSDVLNLLNTYEIKIPFMQTSSTIDTKLDLNIKLDGFDTDANGTFAFDHGTFLYKNINLDASNGLVVLNGPRVDVKSMNLSYKDYVDTNVSGYLIPKNNEGKIGIDLNRINIKDLSISQKQSALHLVYNVTPKQDIITVSPSILHYKKDDVNLNGFDIKFNLQTLYAKIAPFQLAIANKIAASVSGDINLDALTSDLDIKFSKFQYQNFRLNQNSLDLALKYDKALHVRVDKSSSWKYKDSLVTLSPVRALFDQERVKISDTQINFADSFNTKLSVDYDANQSLGILTLQNVAVKNNLLKSFFNPHEKYRLKIDNSDEDTQIAFDQYNTKLNLQKNGLWVLRCQDFNKIYKNVPLLNDLNITNGNFMLSSTANDGEYYFSGLVKSPYKVLVKNNTPLDSYTFYGTYSPEQTDVTVNNDLHININKEIKLSSKGIGFNIPSLVKFTDQHPFKADSNSSMRITLNAQESYLYFSSNRKMMANTLNVEYDNSGLSAQIKYEKGNANFNLNQFGLFYLTGSNFNDQFMEKLFATSKFSKGALSFTFSGSFEDFAGVIEIDNTILKEYGALNNLFAFVNTVPSLVTFQVPGFSQNGLHVKNMYVGFTSKKGMYDLSDISLNSKEIKIFGKGTMNMNNETLDLDLNLKSDLASQASKIPIVGYILFDKDSISTSVKVNGSIYDPQVSTSVAKDIMIAPLNILKRTLLLPIELFTPSSDK